jgi:hypothetical protein
MTGLEHFGSWVVAACFFAAYRGALLFVDSLESGNPLPRVRPNPWVLTCAGMTTLWTYDSGTLVWSRKFAEP